MAMTKRAIVAVFFFLGFQPLYAQRPSSPGSANATAIMPVLYISNSIVDNRGNLFIFQASYQKGAFSTRVTVITPSKVTIGPRDYPGSLSTTAVGEKAIYAINTTTTATGTSTTSLIDLVALKLDSTGNLPSTLPTFHLDGYTQIKVVPGQTADLLYLIQTTPLLTPIAIPATQASFVRLVQFDGTGFNDQGKVPLP